MAAKRPILLWNQNGTSGNHLMEIFKGLGDYSCISVHHQLATLQSTCHDYDRSCHRKPIILFLAFYPEWKNDLRQLRKEPQMAYQQVIVLGPPIEEAALEGLAELRISNYILAEEEKSSLESVANVLNNFWDICTLG